MLALEAEIEKLNEYYKRTAESDVHIVSMGLCYDVYFYTMLTALYLALNPQKKFTYFKKNWDLTLQDEVKELVKKKVCIGI